ncbi:MAG: DUF5050 domain-containing protein [candidate division Zixibacteria bacterium]|nr:DUF5050 domain-containing protein [candidate division Zixibacteria bacterium]
MLATLVVLLVFYVVGISKGQRKMYWTDATANKNQRANLDGSAVEDLVSSSIPTGIAIDIAGGKMYWTAMGTDKIYRTNLDGSGSQTLVGGLSTPYDICLDIAAGKMYWTDWGADKIQRANLDGSNVQDVITGLSNPRGMDLDLAGGKMYWTDSGPYRIRRANLDGSGIEDVVTGLSTPHDVAVDIVGGKIYWVDAGTADKIQRSNLDGSGVEDLVTGLVYPYGIALDIVNGKMYWADNSIGKILCANLDGSSVEDVVTGLSSPRLIVVLPPTLTYQGRLLNDSSVADGLYDLRFSAYNEEGDSNPLTVTGAQDVDVIDGYFTVRLGLDGVEFNGDGAHWLEIAVREANSTDTGDYVTLSPRQQLTPTPYAVYAENAGVDSDWMVSGNNMYSFPSGRVGIGTMSPSSKLHIEDDTTDDVQITIHNKDNSGSERLFFGTSTASDAGILVYGSTHASTPGKWRFLNNKTSGHFDWLTGASVKMTLNNSGYLGIGTMSPTQKLDVSGSITASRYYDRNNTSYYLDPSSTSSSAKFAGNVGIGTTSPSSKLHVEDDTTGSVQVTIHNKDNSGIERLFFGTSTSSDAGILVYGSTSATHRGKWRFLNNKTSGHFDWLTGASVRMTLTNNGKLGIGTMNPVGGLHLEGFGFPDSFMYLESDSGQDTGFRLYEGSTVKWHLFNESAAGGLSLRNNAYSSVLFAQQSTGNVGIGTTAPARKLTVRGGNILIESSDGTDILELGEGLDYAEGFDVSESTKIDAGTVLIIDADNPGKLAISVKAYDSKVAGIVAGAKGIGSGVRLGAGGFDYDVALAGRVYCNVDATEAGVEPGDLLTTSATPGYAMKSTDYARAQGTILGKAMESLEKGQKGQILVLVTLQ